MGHFKHRPVGKASAQAGLPRTLYTQTFLGVLFFLPQPSPLPQGQHGGTASRPSFFVKWTGVHPTVASCPCLNQ